jgi:phytanoyl-CoA hydroxylase
VHQGALEQFQNSGYVIVRNLCASDDVAELKRLADREYNTRLAPIELETDVGYPGAPTSIASAGGNTIRRLLNAVDRSPRFKAWMCGPVLVERIETLIGEAAVMSRVHHNCIMTKHPNYGSETGWHRDSRYWSFKLPDLVSAWLALGYERPENGALMLVPGSHKLEIGEDRFDSRKFLRSDSVENARLVDSAVRISLNPGDVLFFHCQVLHAAGRNADKEIKWSLVSTYYGVSNSPVPGTRSSEMPCLPLTAR